VNLIRETWSIPNSAGAPQRLFYLVCFVGKGGLGAIWGKRVNPRNRGEKVDPESARGVCGAILNIMYPMCDHVWGYPQHNIVW